jgi:hypothetical protein
MGGQERPRSRFKGIEVLRHGRKPTASILRMQPGPVLVDRLGGHGKVLPDRIDRIGCAQPMAGVPRSGPAGPRLRCRPLGCVGPCGSNLPLTVSLRSNSPRFQAWDSIARPGRRSGAARAHRAGFRRRLRPAQQRPRRFIEREDPLTAPAPVCSFRPDGSGGNLRNCRAGGERGSRRMENERPEC